MQDKVLRARGKSLEESFFAKQSARLLEKLRAEAKAKAKKEAIAEALGVSKEEVLDQLAALDLPTEELVALNLVPLVQVAWADGEIQSKEREAILKAASEHGVGASTVSMKLLESWLETKPEQGLLDAWKAYVAAIDSSISSASRDELKAQVINRARVVAEAAGGFLGLGTISDAEKAMLSELEKAFI
jgi:hypothetical protein